ncbi:MAG: ABC transporter ATP-binding protein, partial [Bacteroidia bacterium]|nr:ABC transporter ATP-binding protein [Bacteroidia bacterium]
RKGEKLYSGRVDEMISSHGFFELKTQQNDALLKFLKEHQSFDKIKVENDIVTAFLTEPMEAEAFNEMMFNKGIILSHLVKRKESLEEQFLQLTDKSEI